MFSILKFDGSTFQVLLTRTKNECWYVTVLHLLGRNDIPFELDDLVTRKDTDRFGKTSSGMFR